MAKHSRTTPDFEAALSRGAVSEPRPRYRNSQRRENTSNPGDNSLSLFAALDNSKYGKNDVPNNMSVLSEGKGQRKKKVANNNRGIEQREWQAEGRQHTPATIPRTKFTAATPLEQKLAINRLRQRLHYEDDAKDGEINDVAPVKEQNLNQSLSAEVKSEYVDIQNDVQSMSSKTDSIQVSLKESDMSDMIDSARIVERLDQVKEYLKQATSMYVNTSTSDVAHASKAVQLEKLAQLIQQLRIQEHGYIDLLQRTVVAEEDSFYDSDSVISKQSQSEDTEMQSVQSIEPNQDEGELQALREQRDLLGMIAEQGRQLSNLKNRHSMLLALQDKAQAYIAEASAEADNNGYAGEQANKEFDGTLAAIEKPEVLPVTEHQDVLLERADAQQKRLELEMKLEALKDKKEQMDNLLATMQAIRNNQMANGFNMQVNEESHNSMTSQQETTSQEIENQGAMSDSNASGSRHDGMISQLLAIDRELKNMQLTTPNEVIVKKPNNKENHNTLLLKEQRALQEQKHQLDVLEEQRRILLELKAQQQTVQTLRLENGNQIVQQQQQQQHKANATAPLKQLYAGGARPREPSSSNRYKRSPGLQNNDNHPLTGVNMVHNEQSNSSAQVNQSVTAQLNLENLLSLADRSDLLSKIEDLQQARDRLIQMQQDSMAEASQSQMTSESEASSVISKQTITSDSGSEASGIMAWQDDPEFHAKVAKLQLAKQKLKHLQELVKAAQQGPGVSLPIDDLVDLTLSEADDNDDVVVPQTESEDGEDTDADNQVEASGYSETEATIDEVQESGEQEVAYRAKLLQQQAELEHLLHEKEKLLHLKRKLIEGKSKSSVQTQTPSLGINDGDSLSSGKQRQGHSTRTSQARLATESRSTGRQKSAENGPEDRTSSQRVSKVRLQLNPRALSELRRQRELLEMRKKQKFKERLQQISETNQSVDYSITSDVDEGVVVGATSIDNTTATWGGSSLQSNSSDGEDSAVGDEEELADNDMDYDCYGQVEEEEEEAGHGLNEEIIPPPACQAAVPPLFHVKAKNLQGIRKINRWPSSSQHRSGAKRKRAELSDGSRKGERASAGSVSWSSKPPSNASNGFPRKQPRRANQHIKRLTKNHLERHDWEQQFEQMYQQLVNSTALSSSLLRNQQTLIAMIQNHGMLSHLNSAGTLPFPTLPNLADGLGQSNVPSLVTKLQDHLSQSKLSNRTNKMMQTVDELSVQMKQQQADIISLENLVKDLVYRVSPALWTPGFDVGGPSHVPTSVQSSVRVTVPQSSDFEYKSGSTAFKQSVPRQPDSYAVPVTQSTADSRLFGNSTTEGAASLFQNSTHPYTHEYVLFGSKSNDASPGMERNPAQSSSVGNAASFSPFRMYETGFYDGRDTLHQESAAAVEVPSFTNEGTQMQTESAIKNRYNPQGFYDSAIAAVSKSQLQNAAKWSTPTPSKPAAVSSLAGKIKQPEVLPSSSGNQPTEKSVSTRPDIAVDAAENHSLARTPSNFSLFEALRESIYSEVATLISMNEAKPHFLIELFRELQLLTSDYLRQRALYSLQDLVTRYLTEDTEHCEADTKEGHNWTAGSVSEQTPSESVLTTDDDNEEQRMLQALVGENHEHDAYDYAELAELTSSVSTPVSNADHPFASDGLGETVINLEEAMQQIRRYDEAMAETQQALKRMSGKAKHVKRQNEQEDNSLPGASGVKHASNQASDDARSNSTYDVGSETSADTQPASADVQRLDGQIKWIMRELIPFLNDRMEELCTADLLSQIRHVVIVLAKQNEPDVDKEEFGRFFHRQLESILRDTLGKFAGRRLRECGEELLIDVSEILFNELAFFRLMEDLDKPVYYGHSKELTKMRKIVASVSANRDDPNKKPMTESDNVDSETTQDESDDVQVSEDSSDHLSEDYVKVDGFMRHPSAASTSERPVPPLQLENDLDEAAASGVGRPELSDIGSDVDEQTESAHQFINVQLAACESRPNASTGSGEEDAGDDTANGNVASSPSGGPATAVISSRRDQSSDSETESQEDRSTMPESDESRRATVSLSGLGNASPAVLSAEDQYLESVSVAIDQQEDEREEHGQHADEDDGDEATRDTISDETAAADDVDESSAVMAEDEQDQDDRCEDVQHDAQSIGLPTHAQGACAIEADVAVESEEVTIDDLPTKLTGLTEADLQTRMASEERANHGVEAVLSYLSGTQELAGDEDPSSIRTPDPPCNGDE